MLSLKGWVIEPSWLLGPTHFSRPDTLSVWLPCQRGLTGGSVSRQCARSGWPSPRSM